MQKLKVFELPYEKRENKSRKGERLKNIVAEVGSVYVAV